MQDRKQPPSHLRKCGKAKWRKLVAENDFSAAETDTLELYCSLWDTLDKLDAELATMGVVVAGSEGQPVVNPVLRERRETIKQIDALMVALAIPVDGESFGVRRSGSARAAVKAKRPPKMPPRGFGEVS
jgi:P27 family predicted phage terminase small subunit